MKERPILFSAPMVRAILAGTKTQTRRVVKPGGWNPASDEYSGLMAVRAHDDPRIGLQAYFRHQASGTGHGVRCPYGQPGDRLWVRETWAPHFIYGNVKPSDILIDLGSCLFYRADGAITGGCNETQRDSKWRPAIHMPRAASRITLEVTDVRVERLQDISQADAQAEGCSLECMTPTGDDSGSAIHGPGGYIALWESINGPGSWDANPWVWVVEFRKVHNNEVGRMPANAQKPRIQQLMSGGWLCEGANLGGTAWTRAGAYRAWLWNMLHNGEPHRIAEYGLTPGVAYALEKAGAIKW